MLHFLTKKLPLIGLTFVCGISAAQATACVTNSKEVCPMEVSSPSMQFPLFCSNGSPAVALDAPVTYTIKNNTPTPAAFTYGLASRSSLGAVTITSTTCSGSMSQLEGDGILPAYESCQVTLSVKTDTSCTPGFLNWVFDVTPDNPRQPTIVRVIDPEQLQALSSPTLPTVTCAGSTTSSGTIPAVAVAGLVAPLCMSGTFATLGGATLTNPSASLNTKIINGYASASRFGVVGAATSSTIFGLAAGNLSGSPSGLGVPSTAAAATDNVASTSLVNAITAFITLGLNNCANPSLGMVFPEDTVLGDGPGADVAILSPGTYCLDSTDLIGKLRLKGAGNYIFIVSGNLNLMNDGTNEAGLILMNGATASNVYWIVGSPNGSDFTVEAAPNGGSFAGTVMNRGNITLGTGVKMTARLLSTNGTVTLNENEITRP